MESVKSNIPSPAPANAFLKPLLFIERGRDKNQIVIETEMKWLTENRSDGEGESVGGREWE